MKNSIELPEVKNKILFQVRGIYEDGDEDIFKIFDNYTQAEQYIWNCEYEAFEYYIRKVWVRK